MKKVSILIALALLLTVGGVYATWTYANQPITAVSRTATIQMAALGTESEAGVITPLFNGARIVIDDTGSYKAGVTTEGSLDITFQPNAGSPDNIKDGIIAEYYVEWTGANTYKDDENQDIAIFTTTSTSASPVTIALTTDSNADGAYEASISVADLVDLLDFTQPTVDTLSEYTALSNVLSAGTFRVTVSFKTAD